MTAGRRSAAGAKGRPPRIREAAETKLVVEETAPTKAADVGLPARDGRERRRANGVAREIAAPEPAQKKKSGKAKAKPRASGPAPREAAIAVAEPHAKLSAEPPPAEPTVEERRRLELAAAAALIAGAAAELTEAQRRSLMGQLLALEPAPSRTPVLLPAAPARKASAGSGESTAHDFEIIAENLARLVDQGRKALAAAVGGIEPGDTRSELASNVADATKTLGAVAERWMAKPEQAVAAQADLLTGLGAIWSQTLRRFSGADVPPVVPPDPNDKRFAAPEWRDNPFFDCLRQSYALTTRWAGDAVERTEGLDPQTKSKAAFYTRLIASALSPSNFVATNPELLRATLDARGENLVRGMKMLTEDLSAGRGMLKLRQSDESKFELGVDMADTPGKVVFRTAVMELIQYAPSTPTVYARPLLIVPPWINKFYVLDLNREKSFVRWATAQGLTVFVISWVNPDESQAEKGFEAYMKEGVLAALDAVQQATGARHVAAAGYCVGGTMLAATLAYMAEKGDDRIDSVTFLATQVDFTDAGDMQVFIDEARLAALDEAMSRTGYLEGVKMATTFNLLRPNELFWTYFVNNYMKGVEPAAFDLLTWNSDCTRIPRANHLFYLRYCYIENALSQGRMVIDGVTLNLRKVKIPIYELAAKEDHIAPARSVFTGAKYFGGDVRYVLAGAGHIAGVVNPPDKNKYQYWTGGPPTGVYEDWVKTAKETKGSWWPDWLAWITAQAPEQVPARLPGDGALKPICDAPGEYVRVRA
ncbi:class I poly(R)-hydroxyalkanoic acid synthase [Methylosinus sp. Sm6]|uniref:class I poly(R)-hydroxyalkanoic acid synthase n=1 Tax=Methylosinus sp. Sm6 TaxID=2866948 RepID=UPI001C999924|nr:class I poly(R)-hydroxyalkanoic acid synthase [Methylosinus sp. Sm6]MBY6240806.1 class I poly(R)-hydroxyalkanoic acid synthase [Methylosinus sp. Sm6]